MRFILTSLVILSAWDAYGQVVRVSGREIVCENGVCRTLYSYGTGFIVHETPESQWIVTAAHLFRDKAAWVGLGARTMRPCELVHVDNRCDVALVRTARRFSGGVLPLDVRPLSPGEAVSFMGYGGQNEYVPRPLSGVSIDTERLTFASDSGDSGGPLVVNGKCAGVMITTARNGQYSRMAPCHCWFPWLTRYVPVPVRQAVPEPPPEPIRIVEPGRELEALQKQVHDLTRLVLDLSETVKQIPKPTPHPDVRVVLTEGNKILDDETYKAGEPIVLDVERIRKGGK